jgi:hypothetical protein
MEARWNADRRTIAERMRSISGAGRRVDVITRRRTETS